MSVMSLLRLTFVFAASLAGPLSAFELSLDVAGKAVVLKAAQPAEVVRYTLNGKDPDFSAGIFLEPIVLPEGGTVKAAAFDGNKRVGEVRTQVVPGPGPKNTALVPLTQNRDWKSYDWVTRHNEILALNQPGAMRADVVFLGDSITHFWSGEPKAKRVSGKDSWEKWIAP
ncbi:MAG: hypothetical protein RL749_582, partial [Verrucomicrobiota bacterium]